MPDNDAEPVGDGSLERAALVGAVGPGWDADEAAEARVRGPYHGEEPLDLVGVADQFGSCADVVAAQVEPHWMAVSEVLGPAAAAGGEEHVAVGDVADRLAVTVENLTTVLTSSPPRLRPSVQR